MDVLRPGQAAVGRRGREKVVVSRCDEDLRPAGAQQLDQQLRGFPVELIRVEQVTRQQQQVTVPFIAFPDQPGQNLPLLCAPRRRFLRRKSRKGAVEMQISRVQYPYHGTRSFPCLRTAPSCSQR